MDAPPARRFWQLHLSTAVLMMLAAGTVMWFSVGRFFAIGPARQSEWVETDGLAARISVENSNLMLDSNKLIRLELKNTSKNPYRVYENGIVPEEITLTGLEGTEIQPTEWFHFPATIPSVSAYTYLLPGGSLQHKFYLYTNTQGDELTIFGRHFRVLGRDVLVRAQFSDGDFREVAELNALRVPIWPGSITTAPIRLTIDLPWTTHRTVSAVAYVVMALVLTAAISEFIVRRIESRKRPPPPVLPS